MGRENTISTGTAIISSNYRYSNNNKNTSYRLAPTVSNDLGIVLSINPSNRQIIYAPLYNNVASNKRGTAKPSTLNFQQLPKPGSIVKLKAGSDNSISNPSESGKNTIYYDPTPIGIWQELNDNKIELNLNTPPLLTTSENIKKADIGIPNNNRNLQNPIKKIISNYFIQNNNKSSNTFTVIFGGIPSKTYGYKFMYNEASKYLTNKNIVYSDWENDVNQINNFLKQTNNNFIVDKVIGFSKGGLRTWSPGITGKYSLIGLIDPSIEGAGWNSDTIYNDLKSNPQNSFILTYLSDRGWGMNTFTPTKNKLLTLKNNNKLPRLTIEEIKLPPAPGNHAKCVSLFFTKYSYLL